MYTKDPIIICAMVRVSEVIVKSCQFTSAAITSDGQFTYAVGTDGYLRHLKQGNIERETMFLPNGVDCLVLSNSDLMLFASGNEGVCYSIKLPFLDSVKHLEYTIHCTTVDHVSFYSFQSSTRVSNQSFL